jgi:hypothetical protein
LVKLHWACLRSALPRLLWSVCWFSWFSMIISNPWDLAYWIILVPGYYLETHTLPLINFWTFNHHGVNLIFMLIEFVFNRIPMYDSVVCLDVYSDI